MTPCNTLWDTMSCIEGNGCSKFNSRHFLLKHAACQTAMYSSIQRMHKCIDRHCCTILKAHVAHMQCLCFTNSRFVTEAAECPSHRTSAMKKLLIKRSARARLPCVPLWTSTCCSPWAVAQHFGLDVELHHAFDIAVVIQSVPFMAPAAMAQPGTFYRGRSTHTHMCQLAMARPDSVKPL